jgi:hypothetical protein
MGSQQMAEVIGYEARNRQTYARSLGGVQDIF